MRFVVFGAGAVGGTIGGRLFQHGERVALIARGEHGRTIAKDGLTLRSGSDVVTLKVPTVAAPEDLEWQPGDVVVLAMKTQDTTDALDALTTVAPRSTPIVCAQNGVENERLALRRFARVYGMCVMLPATHLEPGVVDVASTPVSGILDVGCYPDGVDEVAHDVAAALERSSFSSRPEPAIMRRKYAKLLMNLGNALQAALGAGAPAEELRARARAEALACFAAAGIDWASDEEDRERRGSILTPQPIEGATRGGGSSWQSLARGTGRIESDFLNGEVVLLGRLHGVATPVNAMLQEVATELARTGAAPGSLTVDELEARLP